MAPFLGVAGVDQLCPKKAKRAPCITHGRPPDCNEPWSYFFAITMDAAFVKRRFTSSQLMFRMNAST